jgi:hypothetical protein
MSESVYTVDVGCPFCPSSGEVEAKVWITGFAPYLSGRAIILSRTCEHDLDTRQAIMLRGRAIDMAAAMHTKGEPKGAA